MADPNYLSIARRLLRNPVGQGEERLNESPLDALSRRVGTGFAEAGPAWNNIWSNIRPHDFAVPKTGPRSQRFMDAGGVYPAAIKAPTLAPTQTKPATSSVPTGANPPAYKSADRMRALVDSANDKLINGPTSKVNPTFTDSYLGAGHAERVAQAGQEQNALEFRSQNPDMFRSIMNANAAGKPAVAPPNSYDPNGKSDYTTTLNNYWVNRARVPDSRGPGSLMASASEDIANGLNHSATGNPGSFLTPGQQLNPQIQTMARVAMQQQQGGY